MESIRSETHPIQNTTMRELVARYIEEILLPCLNIPLGGTQDPTAGVSYCCARSYITSLTNYVLPKWGGYLVRDFERPEIQASVEDWSRFLLRPNRDRGLAPTSVLRIHAAMQQLFKFGLKRGYF